MEKEFSVLNQKIIGTILGGCYGDVLGSAGINSVAEYVWQQALTNWPS